MCCPTATSPLPPCRIKPPVAAILLSSATLPNGAHIHEASRRPARPHELHVVHLPPPRAPPRGHLASGYLRSRCHRQDLRLGSLPLHDLITGAFTAPPACCHQFPQPLTHITIEDDPGELLCTLTPTQIDSPPSLGAPHHLTDWPQPSGSPNLAGGADSLHGWGQLPSFGYWASSPALASPLDLAGRSHQPEWPVGTILILFFPWE
jgi:hypothetical protein